MVQMKFQKMYMAAIAMLVAITGQSQNKAIEGIKVNFKTQEACWNAGDLVCYMKAYATTEEIWNTAG